ncbi:transcriptional regulator [Enterococcus sp. 669A]|uniref:Transcriptional regulator n=1 Tax=Candidatus Enterococcus moelleringii TaxID=2815325 RepID=A0ABS3LCQ2_9ENTE|nr:transcriptional regulator [Enterococcus sp. 669A]MBO1306169.1 transcriptional regulator [Enterococcus sp. 669A]
MEKWKKDYLKGILAEYPQMDQYIKEKELELSLSQANKREATSDGKLLITLSSDRRLRNLERNQAIIKECLENAEPEIQKIIEELYMNTKKEHNLDYVADQVFLSTRQVTRLRNQFFMELAEKLGI